MALRPPLVLKSGEKQQHQADDTLEVKSTPAFSGSMPTGGTITTSGLYTIHTFIANGNFVIPAGMSLQVEVLIVAGGGGGGSGYPGQGNGGGGGGGGIISETKLLNPDTYAVVVGAGGNGGQTNGGIGFTGSGSSIIGSLQSFSLCIGGGGGAGGVSGAGVINGANGGCGGGGNGGYGGAGGSGSMGGNGGSGAAVSPYCGGGGGGAGPNNGSNAGLGTYGNGGDGFVSSISGSSVTYAGGGGGGSNDPVFGGTGGAGGGGAGRGTGAGFAGTTNRGGGGGGGGNQSPANGGAGGSGIVILRYLTPNDSQLRVSYDASNYLDIIIGSAGAAIFKAVGTSSLFYWLLNNVFILRATTARIKSYLPIQFPIYTVSTLPSAEAGDRAIITDAISPTFGSVVVGGGSSIIPVYNDGTSWRAG